MSKNRLTFTLMDMGYKKAGPIQVNIVPHALMLKDRAYGNIDQEKA